MDTVSPSPVVVDFAEDSDSDDEAYELMPEDWTAPTLGGGGAV